MVELNVGGSFFTTSLLTLTKCEGSMLHTMFSGHFKTVTDKHGRYFIDSDGNTFQFILNYLRFGVLPPPDSVESVYRDALYFGIQELIGKLERYPAILKKVHQESFRNGIPGYQSFMEAILDVAVDPELTRADKRTYVYVSIFRQEQRTAVPRFDKNHCCVCMMLDGDVTAIASLGPWRPCTSEKDVLDCVIYDLEQSEFVVTLHLLDPCNYGVILDNGKREGCKKLFYCITFHWWRF